MALESSGGGINRTATNNRRKTAEDRVALGTPTPSLAQYGSGYTTGYYNQDDPFLTNTGVAPDPYKTMTGVTSEDVGNQFLDNPTAAVNNIMQGLGLSVSSNSPFYNRMSQLAPGLEWLQYFQNGTYQPEKFLSNVGNWMNQGMSGAFGGRSGLGNILENFLSGGNTDDLSAMIDNMTPEDITRAIASLMETGLYGEVGSRVRQGLQARLLDQYNVFAGQQPTYEAGLAGTANTIADKFLEYMRGTGLLDQLGF